MAVLSESARTVFATIRTVLDQRCMTQETFEEFTEHLMDVALDEKMTSEVAYAELRSTFLHAFKVATAPGRSYTPNHLGNEVLDEIEAFVETVKNSKTSLLKPLFAARKVQEKLAAPTA